MFGRLLGFHGCANGALVGPYAIYPYIMRHKNGIHGLSLIEVAAIIGI